MKRHCRFRPPWLLLGASVPFLLFSSAATGQLVVTDRVLIQGSAADSRLGEAAAVGDFNGDGFEDLALGQPRQDFLGAPDAGFVRIYLGGPDGINPSGASDRSFSEAELGGETEAGDLFGAALAAADFDLDGFDDLVVGIPGKEVSGFDNAGRIAVINGDPVLDLDFSSALFLDQFSGLSSSPTAGEQLGATLAAGALGDEAHPDLAIGVPGERVTSSDNAGAVHVLFSDSSVGLELANQAFLTQDVAGAFGIASPDDRFGSALAIGEVTSDGLGDLVVGTPGDLVGLEPGSGSVQIFAGSGDGVAVDSTQRFWDQDDDDVLGVAASGDEFGASIALGDFDGDGETDLAIGVPGESQFGPEESGIVQVLYGTSTGLTATGNQVFFESLISPEIATFDRFGEKLAAGDFSADGRDDLAIGYPLDNVFGIVNAGNVAVLYGAPGGLGVAGSQLWNGFFLLTVESGDELGSAVVAGDFTGNGVDGLAIGMPGREIEGVAMAGGGFVLRSRSLFSDDFESGDSARWSEVQ